MKRKATIAPRGLALVRSDGKVMLSFQQQRSNATRLDSEDVAAFVRALREREKAQESERKLIDYLSAKYSLVERDVVSIDGVINRASRTPIERGGPR